MNIGERVSSWCESKQINCFYKPQVGSTNDEAKSSAFATDRPFTLFTCDYQTKGRGRGTNQWDSGQPGRNLYLSFLMALPSPPQHFAAPLLGLFTFQSLKEIWPQLNWSIKPPNDILLDGRKVAGLLTESVSQSQKHALIFGLGINVFEHPSNISDSTHLVAHLGNELDPSQFEQFLDNLLNRLKNQIEKVLHMQMTEQTSKNLTEAIQLNPHIGSRLLRVDQHANLHYTDQQVRWTDL